MREKIAKRGGGGEEGAATSLEVSSSQPFQPEPVDRLLKIDFVTLDPPHDSDKNCDRLKGFVLESHTLDIKDTKTAVNKAMKNFQLLICSFPFVYLHKEFYKL